MRSNAAIVALVACMSSSACVSNGPDDPSDDEAAEVPTISVTVPPERLTPFCEAMIELSDDLRSGPVDDADGLIIDTYRSIRPDVPPEIATDFDLVLQALEAGLPAPTDPPIEPTTVTAVTGSDPTATVGGSVDEGFDPDTSPAERINSYVAFACRGTGNNPGPPPTQPTGDAVATEG